MTVLLALGGCGDVPVPEHVPFVDDDVGESSSDEAVAASECNGGD